jgi:hypothetical protein
MFCPSDSRPIFAIRALFPIQVKFLNLISLTLHKLSDLLLVPDILHNTLFSDALSLCPYLNVSDQVSHPYQTTCENPLLYILIFKTHNIVIRHDPPPTSPVLTTLTVRAEGTRDKWEANWATQRVKRVGSNPLTTVRRWTIQNMFFSG